MRNRILVAAVLVVAATPTAQARQPIHESLVECAVLVEVLLGEETPIPGRNAYWDLYHNAAQQMRAEAARQMNAAYVDRVSHDKRALWHQRWDDNAWHHPQNREELTDWWRYCFSLAEYLDLPLE